MYNRLLTVAAEEELKLDLSSPAAQFALQTGAGVCAGATSGLLTTPLARCRDPGLQTHAAAATVPPAAAALSSALL